jgi:hypothetical protein
MSLASLRGRLRDLAARWAGPSSTWIRGTIVMALGAGATVGAAQHLGITYPVGDWLFWQIGTLWAWCLFLSAACVSAGHLVLGRVFRVRGRPVLETVVTSAALGLIVFTIGMYLVGAARQYNARFAVLLPALMIAAGAPDFVAFVRERREIAREEAPVRRDPWKSAVAAAAAAFGVAGLVFVYLEAMTPEAINFDASWSHIPIAVDYARHGRLIPFDADYTRNFPHLASFVHTWAMIVPSWGVLTEEPLRWMLALHLEFSFFVWTLAGVAAMARWLLDDDRVRGAWAAFFLFPSIFVYDNNLGGAADHYLAFFAPVLFLAVVRAAPAFDVRACALVGVIAAGPLLTKYQAVYLLAGVGAVLAGLWIAAAVRRSRADRGGSAGEVAPPTWKTLVVAPAAVIAAFAIATSPHFVKNWVFYGNPLYPFAQDVFHSHPTTPNAAYLFEWLFKDYTWRPHGTFLQNVVDAVVLCFTYSFAPHYAFWTKNWPHAGHLFTLCLPMAIFARGTKRIWLGIAASMAALFAWGMIFRVDRHLVSFMPLLVATTAALLARVWDLGWMARAGIVPLVCLQAIWGGDAVFYNGHSRLSSAIDLIRSGYDGRVKTRYRNFRVSERSLAAALPPDAKLVLHTYRPNLGIDHDLMLDWAGQQGLITYEGVHGPRGLYDYFRSLGVTHLIWIPGHRAAGTKQEDVLFTDLVHRFAKTHRRFGAYDLVDMPNPPPPPDHPYHVLSIGLGGYKDGLYPVEAMKAYEGVPEHREKFPPPERPLPKPGPDQLAMADESDAVILGEKARPDASLKQHIDQLFETGQTYKGFTIYVRKGGVAGGPALPSPSPALPDDDVEH